MRAVLPQPWIGVHYHWSTDIPLVVRAMVLTPDQLLVAGPAVKASHADSELPAAQDVDSLLMVYSTEEGRSLARVKLPSPPAFDSMAAADGQVYVTCLDAAVRCYGRPGGAE